MPTVMTHAFAAAALSTAFNPPSSAVKLIAFAALCGFVPDLDVIGFRFGVRYGDLLGHRGFSHSILFALIFPLFITFTFFPEVALNAKWRLILCFFLATISHAVLDAFTNGGLGVAFFAPWDNTRYFFSFTPIRVAPFSVRALLSSHGLVVLKSEFIWVWIPSLIFMLGAVLIRRNL